MEARFIIIASLFVAACARTALETPSDHPANPSMQSAPPQSQALALSPGFDPFEAYAEESSAPEAGQGHEHQGKQAPATTTQPLFTCPMHPDVVREGPGNCPVCGMKLVPKKPESKKPESGHHHAH